MRFSRFLSITAWLCAPAFLVAQDADTSAPETINPLYFSGEPIGDEPQLFYDLDADARRLLQRSPPLAPLDPAATTLARGDRIRAFAEAIAAENSPDADIRARSQVRRAWILAQLGAVNYGTEYANEARNSAAVRGELHLARAWLLWQTGDFESADREAALAAGSAPAAPAWALAAWKKHRAAHTAAAEALAKLPEPEGSTTPGFLAYGHAARAAGAFNVAEHYYFSAFHALQQERDAVPATSPDRLFQAAVARRDILLGMLGEPSPASVGPRLWSTAVAAAHSAAVVQPDQSAWEKYFSLLAVAVAAIPDFDFTDFDVPGDLTRAEAECNLPPVWRARLAVLLARPEVRYASREIQAVRRLEQHPAFQFQFRTLDDAYSNDELAQLEVFVDLHAHEVAALRKFRAQLPADTPAGSRDFFFARLGLTQAIRVAAAKRDYESARETLATLQALRTPDGQPVPEADELARALSRHDRKTFYAAIAGLADSPPAALDRNALREIQAKADQFHGELSERIGRNYATRFNLAPADVLLAHYLAHVRFLQALTAEELLVVCDRFNALEARTRERGVPAYPHLDSARTVLSQLPADPLKATPDERALLDVIAAKKIGTVAMVKQAQALSAASPDRLNPALVLALTYWRLGHDDEASAQIARLRERAHAHPPTLEQLARMERNNSTILIMQDHLAKLAQTTPATRADVIKRADADGNLMANRIYEGHGGENFKPSQIPPIAREGYAYAVTVAGITRLTKSQLIFPAFALDLVRRQARPPLVARLETAFHEAAFAHDLPNAAAIQVWRDLLQTTALTPEASTALAQRASAFEADSVSIRLAATALGLRRSNWDESRRFIANLRTQFGANRAFARQLDAIEACITDCLALQSSAGTGELDRRRQAHLNDKNRAEAERRRMAVAWDQAPEGFKQNWDLTNDRRQWEQLAREMEYHQGQINAIDAEKSGLANANHQAVQAHLARLFRDLNAAAGL